MGELLSEQKGARIWSQNYLLSSTFGITGRFVGVFSLPFFTVRWPISCVWMGIKQRVSLFYDAVNENLHAGVVD